MDNTFGRKKKTMILGFGYEYDPLIFCCLLCILTHKNFLVLVATFNTSYAA